MFKKYYKLTKPGIIYGNLLTVFAGYFFASKFNIQISKFLFVILGSSLVIAAAGVFNNLIDAKIDSLMERTKKRSIVTKQVSKKVAIIYGLILSLLGFFALYKVNYLVLICGFIGIIDYLFLYGYTKRHSVYGTLIGSISGSIPIVSGYLAYVNKIDFSFWILFLMMVCWQMAHFYAIGIFRISDYLKAQLPLMPIIKGLFRTKIEMVIYILLFLALNIVLFEKDKLSIFYIIVMSASSLYWIFKTLKGFVAKNDQIWGKELFRFSLIIVLIFSFSLSIGKII